MRRRLTLDWPRCQPRRGEVDRAQLERHLPMLEAEGDDGPTVVLYSGAHPAWLGPDFWLDLDSPDVFRDWVETVVDSLAVAGEWLPIDRPNDLALSRYVGNRRLRMATGYAIRCLDNLVAAHALAADYIRSRRPYATVRLSTQTFIEYELDRLVVDLLLHGERGVSRRDLHEHLTSRRTEWYGRLPSPTVKQRVARHYTASGIPLEQAFPRAQAAIAACEGPPLDVVEFAGLDRMTTGDHEAYLRAAGADSAARAEVGPT